MEPCKTPDLMCVPRCCLNHALPFATESKMSAAQKLLTVAALPVYYRPECQCFTALTAVLGTADVVQRWQVAMGELAPVYVCLMLC